MSFRYQGREILRSTFNKRRRDRLQYPSVSVFSSNCVGGIICHDLGLRFDSPTVNLFMYPADYLRFLSDLPHYLSVELKQVHEDGAYPIGMLDDVRIDFVHYGSFQEASTAWKRRCARVNLNRCCAIMVDRDGCTKEQAIAFSELPFESKAFLTAATSDLPCAVSHGCWLEPGGVQTRDLCAFRNVLSFHRWIDEFDVVNFLNGAGGIVDS